MRDPDRIDLILAALGRQWREQPDLRLGQLLVNLLREEMAPPREHEGARLFNVPDGDLLRWLGAETAEEDRYIREEPRKAREGWQESQRRFAQSEVYRAWQETVRGPEDPDETS